MSKSPEERLALAEAANTLVADADAKALYAQMRGVLDVVERNIPVRLVGRPAVLNPLLRLAVEDHAAYDRLIELIERKRVGMGLQPLTPEETNDRRAYMREFMAVRRDRLRRLVELWNELRSENDRIRGAQRMQFEQVHGARWKDEKDRREEALRARLGRRLTIEERLGVSAKLWEDVEDELAELQAFVRDEIRKPLHARSSTGFQFKVGAPPRKVN